MVCDHCGAPVEVPAAGGTASCGHCRAQLQVRVRGDVALRGRTPASEHERLALLAAQDHRPPVPPSVAALTACGRVLPTYLVQARTMWQSLRASVRAGAGPEPQESLFVLSCMLAERLLDDGDLTGHRALLESAVDVLSSPRHQQVLRAYIARGACRAGDLQAAQAWLAQLSPQSDDLPSDTAYRYARAYYEAARGSWTGVLSTLNSPAGQVPLWDQHEAECVVLCAHAWERMEQLAVAVDLLFALKRRGGPAMRARGTRFIAIHPQWNLCARSEPQAERMLSALSPKVESTAGTAIVIFGATSAYGLLGVLVGIAMMGGGLFVDAAVVGAGAMVVLYGAIVGLLMLGLLILFYSTSRRRARTRMLGEQVSAQILDVRPDGEAFMPGSVGMHLSLIVFPEQSPAYQASISVSFPQELAPRIRRGAPIVVTINPDDSKDLELSLI